MRAGKMKIECSVQFIYSFLWEIERKKSADGSSEILFELINRKLFILARAMSSESDRFIRAHFGAYHDETWLFVYILTDGASHLLVQII